MDKNRAESLLNYGVRTYRIIAIVELHSIVYRGKILSLEEARLADIIEPVDSPVLEFRAFGTHVRVADAEQKDGFYIDDAIKLVAQELGLETMSVEEYYQWFSHTLNDSMRKMYHNVLTNKSLHEKDVTLDCRMVDLDGVEEWSVGKKFYEQTTSDLRAARNILDSLATHLKRVGKIDMPTYRRFFQENELWFQEIFNKQIPIYDDNLGE